MLSCIQLFCDPMDCILSGSSVPRIAQARILEWAAISYSRKSSQPTAQTCVSCTDRQVLYYCTAWGSS